jgi:uncharacterized protein YqgV (UPF0045/DUF77 family)
MNISAEISLYPLQEQYGEKILEFLEKIQADNRISIETNAMSTLLTGDYDTIMEILTQQLRQFFEDHKAVFIVKISNGCIIDE